MRKTLLSLVFLPLLVSNTSCTNVETVIETEATGENASVYTEITNIVNGEETKVESDQPGEIKVEVKNGEVKVESSSDLQPTIIIGQENEEKTEEIANRTDRIKTKIINFFESLISRLREALPFFHT